MVVTETRLAEYGAASRKLLPPGLAWAGETLLEVLEALAYSFAEVDAQAVGLVAETDPRTTLNLLSDWERLLGLPGPCDELEPTIILRRAAVFATYTRTGGQTIAHFVAFAAALGYTVTITDYQAFQCGRSTCTETLSNGDWVHAWTVLGSIATPTFFRAGEGAAGERLVTASNALLECHLEATRPAHSQVLFEYSLPWEGYAPWENLYPDPAIVEVEAPETLVT